MMFRQNSSEVPFGPSNHWLSATANSLWEGFVPTFPRLRFSTLTTIAPSQRYNTTLFRSSAFFAKAPQHYANEPRRIRREASFFKYAKRKKKKPADLHPPKTNRLIFTSKSCARRRFKPLPHYAETHSTIESHSCFHLLELPQAEGFHMNAFQSNKFIKPRVQCFIKHPFQID